MKQGVTYDGWSIGTTAIRVEVLISFKTHELNQKCKKTFK